MFNTHTEFPTAELAGLLSAGVVPADGHILEVGCGAGTETLMLVTAGCSVVAIEPDAELRQRAEERLPDDLDEDQVELLEIDAADYDPEACSFDAAIERLVLINLGEDHQVAIIRMVARALKQASPFLLRSRFADSEVADDFECGWGRVDHGDHTLCLRARDELRRYFTFRGPPTAFAGLITPEHGAARILSAYPLIVEVGYRNKRRVDPA